jgi:hypothetical protein
MKLRRSFGFFGYNPALDDDFAVQFTVGGIGDVLLLNGCIHHHLTLSGLAPMYL